MNNGITIIAKKLSITGNKVNMEDYQIVNGCQTSHVLHNQKDQLNPNILISVKIISTQDEDVTTSIIKATNRQTEVKEDQLLALSDYQKKIESYFTTFEDPNKLYYERRSKQYNNIAGIEKTRIITLGSLIRAFGSVFLGEPHRATRYYQTLLEQVGTNIFVSNHRIEMYYASALLLYKLEFLFRNQTLESNYKIARQHMLLAFRVLVTGNDIPPRNSNEMKRLCDRLIGAAQDNDACEKYFKCAQGVIATITGGEVSRDDVKTQAFTDRVVAEALRWDC